MKTRLAILVCAMIAAAVFAAEKEAKVPKNEWLLNGKGYQQALDLQKKTGANMLVYFAKYFPKDQKGLCDWWEKKGLAQPDVQQLVDDYIKVKFMFPLGRDDQELADKWKINKCPVLLVVQTNGWRERAAVFDWPGGKPSLLPPKQIVQNILNASAAHEFKHRNAAPAEEEKPAEKKEQ